MIEKMKEQDCDKDKGISRKKGNNLFYKMIMSRKCLGIFFGYMGQYSFADSPQERRSCPPPLP